MSFASETKKEMTQEESEPCCAKAELLSANSNEWILVI